MDEHDWLAKRFEGHRAHLRTVAHRMLGSPNEADDAVQEAWLRLSRSDTSGVENLGGWLTTVVARVCLDMLRTRTSRREALLGDELPGPVAGASGAADPEQEALRADCVGLAMLVVLDTLDPAERVAFVLHDMFDVPFPEIAPIVGRTPTATRKLASRARQRVRAAPGTTEGCIARQRRVVEAFLAASREGDFEALLALLDPDAVLQSDAATLRAAAEAEARGAPKLAPVIRGAAAVAEAFAGRARAATLAVIDGAAGAAWAPGGQPRAVFAFTIADGRVSAIDLITDPEHIAALDIQVVD